MAHLTRVLPALIGSLLLGATVPAHADIITTRTGAVIPTNDGFFAYTYDATLTGGQLDATTTNAQGNPVPLQFGTVYDFGALARAPNNAVYIATTGLLASVFSFSFNNSDAPASQTAPFDDPTLTNIRFAYVGGTTISAPVGGDNVDLGTFQVYSPFNATNTSVQYDGQSYKTTNDTIQGNVGFTTGPLNPSQVPVPEPATLTLLGLGILGAGVARRRRR